MCDIFGFCTLERCLLPCIPNRDQQNAIFCLCYVASVQPLQYTFDFQALPLLNEVEEYVKGAIQQSTPMRI